VTPRWLEILRSSYARRTNPAPTESPSDSFGGGGEKKTATGNPSAQENGAPVLFPFGGVDVSAMLGKQAGPTAWPAATPNVGPYPYGRPVRAPFPPG